MVAVLSRIRKIFPRVVAVKMSAELVEEIDRVAREMGISRSQLIRTAVEFYLKKLKGIEMETRSAF